MREASEGTQLRLTRSRRGSALSSGDARRRDEMRCAPRSRRRHLDFTSSPFFGSYLLV